MYTKRTTIILLIQKRVINLIEYKIVMLGFSMGLNRD